MSYMCLALVCLGPLICELCVRACGCPKNIYVQNAFLLTLATLIPLFFPGRSPVSDSRSPSNLIPQSYPTYSQFAYFQMLGKPLPPTRCPRTIGPVGRRLQLRSQKPHHRHLHQRQKSLRSPSPGEARIQIPARFSGCPAVAKAPS